jgi:catechol 2,3-dioxygenase-like lactoylglutathione lyase family enzyme
MDQRMSLVTLGVADLARARTFYSEGLGWSVLSPDQTGIVFFQLPGLALALWPVDKLAKDAGLAPRAGGFGGITLAINMPSPAEVDAVIAQAERAGARVLKPAAETFWGGYSGYFSDLDGHPWEVAHNPFCTVAPDGGTVFKPS